MIQFHVYPGGKKRILTFSYDDGFENDVRLVEMFNKYGVKSTFHLNGINYIDMTDDELTKIRQRYQNHEIACHTLRHGWASRMPSQSVAKEVIEDRQILEKIAGYPVLGMSYPCGDYDANSICAMKSCGIVYSRTTLSTDEFGLPEDFMKWNPTCHHKKALELCDKFLNNLDSQWGRPLFYIWGHSHEFRTEDDWNVMKNILENLAHNDKIWYATNMEIYDYINAQRSLKISYDEKTFVNPTATDVWVEKDKKDIIHIPAGQTVQI